jgi:hypothetical protein
VIGPKLCGFVSERCQTGGEGEKCKRVCANRSAKAHKALLQLQNPLPFFSDGEHPTVLRFLLSAYIMSLHNTTSLDDMAIAHPREISPHMIVPSYIEDIHGPGCDKIYTDDPITGIQGRVFHFDVPLTPVKLIPSATGFLDKLKSRGSTHINLLCAEYVAFRYERFAGIDRDVGILLQLPRPRAQNTLNMAKDKDGEVKASKMQNKHLKALVMRLRGKEDE